MIYVDVSNWLLWEHPVTGEETLFKTPFSITRIGGGDPVESLKSELEHRFGAPIELEDLGNWNNTVELDGSYMHPFSGILITNETRSSREESK